MPDIQRYLDDIKKAVYGEEVRGSIHDAIDAINRYTEQYSTKDDIDRAITEALEKAGFSTFKIVDVLPSASEADDHTLYMLYNATSKHYDIYAKLNGKMEWLDDTTIDLSNYVTKEALSHEMETKIDKSDLEGLSGAVQVENGKFKQVTETPPIFTFDAPYGADGTLANNEFDKIERQFAHFTFPKYEEADPLTCNCYTIHFSMSANSPYGDTAPDMGINIIFAKLHLTNLYPEDDKLYTVMYAQYSPGTYLQNGGNCRFYIKNNGEKIITRDGAELRDRNDYYLIPTDVTDLYITAPHITFGGMWFAMHDMKGAKYNIYDLRMSEGVTHEFEVIDRTNKLEFLTSDKNYSELWSDETVVNRAVEAVTLVDEVTFKLEGDVTSPAINTRFDAAYDDGNKIILQTSIDESLKQSIGTAIQTVKVNGEPLVPDESKAVDVKAYNEDNKPEVGGRNLLPGTKEMTAYVGSGSIDGTYNGFNVVTANMVDETAVDYKDIGLVRPVSQIDPDTDYTLSFWARGRGTILSYLYPDAVVKGYNSEGATSTASDGRIEYGLKNNWEHYWVTWHTKDIIDSKTNALAARVNKESQAWICGLKFERGEIATDWTPAPEDLEAEIPTKISELENDSGFITRNDIPEGTALSIFDLCPDGIMHRNLFRGKNLGGSVTAEQLAAIKNGTFKDLFIGDYWTINSSTWVIADMDYFYQAGDTAFTKHHLVIIPQKTLYNAVMNTTNTTEGGYMGSEMYTKNLDQAKEKIKASFGDMVQTHRDNLINATTEGRPSGYIWTDSEVELMTEVMVYGTYNYAVMNTVAFFPTKYTTARQQFAIFALNPYYAFIGRIWYWLRDVVSASGFARCGGDGGAASGRASNSLGVRPYFCIGSNEADADMPVEGPEMMNEYMQHEMEE